MTALRYPWLVALRWGWVAALLLALGMAAPASANRISATLVAERPGAAGGTVMLALDMRPQPGWHGYWSNPGDAGFGMSLDWSLPNGVMVETPRYPVPGTLLVAGLMNHVFEGDYAVLVPLTLPRDAQPGSRLPIRVKADWLACTDRVCVPEHAELRIDLPVLAPDSPAAKDPRFAEWARLLPPPLDASARFALAGDTIRLGIPLPASAAVADPHFFPSDDGLIAYAAPQRFARNGDLLIVELRRRPGASDTPRRLSGVLRLNAVGDGLAVEALPGAVPSGGEPLAPAASPLAPLPLLLLAALTGGLLLNFMPCVFPILSLKALSLTRAGESAVQARREGLAYTAGVVLACLSLGALLLILRAAGEEVGWAFQLQEPGVVAVLLLLMVAITANLLGLFELAAPSFARIGRPSKSDLQGAFATGLLAGFVASPCTGPFMAGAMGAALLLPAPAALALFAALGLGIALPFLAVAWVPALRRALPRPGPWMVRFRRWIALPMGLTALALVWLASRLGGWSFAAASVALAVALVALLAGVGRRQRVGLRAAHLAVGGLAAIAVAGLFLPLAMRSPTASVEGILPARPFSDAALAAARAQGRPVFAWFTADWCLTCKVNEQVAIQRPEVRDAFARAGVIVLRGDWTRRDPAITRYLASQGAAGVPLYVWYPAGGSPPRRLPQVLTPASLTGLVGP